MQNKSEGGDRPKSARNPDAAALAARLREVIDGRPLRQFAADIGVAYTTLQTYLNGRTEPSWSTLIQIARVSGCSIGWLMTGQGAKEPTPEQRITGPTMTREQYIANDLVPPDPEPPPGYEVVQGTPVGLYVTIPRFSVRAAAGGGAAVLDETETAREIVPRWVLRDYTGNLNKLAMIEVVGDSMSPTLNDGDLIIIDRSTQHIPRDGIYVLRIDGDLIVKRVQRNLDGSLVLLSDNPRYAPQHLSPDMLHLAAVVGDVVWPALR